MSNDLTGKPTYQGTLVVRRKDGSIRATVPISGELSVPKEARQKVQDNLPEVDNDDSDTD